MVSDHYLEKYSCNPIQTACVAVLGECSEMICFLAMLAKFWPFNGHKITDNDDFGPLFENVLMQTNSNLVCALIGWVSRIDLLFGHIGQILAL